MKINLQKLHNFKFQCNSLLFITLYTLVTLLFYNNIFWGKIISAMKFVTFYDYLFLLTYFVALFVLSFILFSIIFVKRTTKFLSILFLLINSSALYFMQVYGVPIDKGMVLNVFATDAKEATDLLNLKITAYFLFFGILPSLLIVKTKIIYKKFLKEIFYRALICVCLLIFTFLLLALQYRKTATFVRSTNDSFNYLLPRNYLNALLKIAKHSHQEKQELIEIGEDLKIQSDDTVVIFIVGETARKANFSLYGYSRETNPLLKKENIIALQNVLSCGTSTKVSLPCMFSHLTREEFIHNNKNYEFLPSLLTKKGVNVLYKDNNFGGCKDTCNNTESISTIEMKSEKFCSTGECVDGILLEGVEEYIQNHNGNTFIVLHQNGSHGPRYNKRYPKEFEKFTPVCENSDVSQCSQQELINAYDNTILYNDHFIHTTIEIAKKSKKPTVVIYASDHGESLGENNIYLHGFIYNIAPKEQKEIPLLVWVSESFQVQHKMQPKCIGLKPSYSHDNIFHSILGLFKAETKLYNKDLDIFTEKC